jgi:hypothetical protein
VWFDNDDNSEGKTVAMVCLNTLKVYYYKNDYRINARIKATIDNILAENVRPVWVCENCGGSNVQTKGWVLPNENNKFIDLVSEEINDNWCEDCDSHTCLVSIATMDGHINPDK